MSSHGAAHIRDMESHVSAVEADLEYFRTKRLEPRVYRLVRVGVVGLADLFQAARAVSPDEAQGPVADLEPRVRTLEDGLDELVKGIGTVTGGSPRVPVVIEDMRKERGDYDDFFKIAKRTYSGTLEERVGQLERRLAESRCVLAVFVRALVDGGVLSEEDLQERRRQFEQRGYRNGARVVAHAWVDAGFRERLLAYGRDAVRELGIPPGRLGRLGVAENTADAHHVVVCTLCSCYPADLLGDPPWWYRTDTYKQRIVQDARAMLKEMFELDLPRGVQVRVHDSTSDVRWMVLPRRPAGTEHMNEDQLAELVTPESMVGTAEVRSPASVTAEAYSES